MSKVYVGIDIGLKGAVARITNDEDPIGFKMPVLGKEVDPHDIIEQLGKLNADYIVFEKLGVIFGSSKATAYSMGKQSGIIETACICLGVPYTAVKAIEWQKDMFTGVTEAKKSNGKRDTKAMALTACKRIFPGVELTMSDKATVPHDGYVDALLMAEWAKRKNL
jgi:hypothetical protein